jgi:hypothetical protein
MALLISGSYQKATSSIQPFMCTALLSWAAHESDTTRLQSKEDKTPSCRYNSWWTSSSQVWEPPSWSDIKKYFIRVTLPEWCWQFHTNQQVLHHFWTRTWATTMGKVTYGSQLNAAQMYIGLYGFRDLSFNMPQLLVRSNISKRHSQANNLITIWVPMPLGPVQSTYMDIHDLQSGLHT